ncbi:MAG TPA: discoidin domain-containing protein [Streptosporangiaceae bacterium]|jgi:hypothetical protein
MRKLRILVSAVAAVGTMLISFTPGASAGTGTDGYQVLDNSQKSALDLRILERYVPFAENLWRASDIPEPDTGMFYEPGAADERGIVDTDYIYATLLTALPGQQSFAGVPRATLMDHLIESIRYAGLTNYYSGAGYNKWGASDGFGVYGPALEMYLWGDAAHIVWNQLDPQTQALVQTVITAASNVFVSEPALDATPGNTGAETDAWTAPLPALAAMMFPSDPNRAAWEQTAIRFTLNSFSVPGDESSSQIVDGKPLSDWITTSNLQPDLTIQNHGYFNLDYQMVTSLLVNDAATFYAQGGMPQPEAFSFRTPEIWNKVIEPLTTDYGDLISPAGQDWVSKDFQWVDYFGALATRFHSATASVLESRALQLVARRQLGTGTGSMVGTTGLVYESVMARRVASDWWDHDLFTPSATPSAPAFHQAYDESSGVHTWPSESVIAGRFATAAASMSWDSDSPMGTWVPRSHDDMTDPAFTDTAPGSLFATARGTPTGPYTCACGTDEFTTAGTVGDKDLAMAAFPDGTTLLLDQGSGPTFTYYIDQIPGLTGDRTVYSAGGTGQGTLSGDWVDVGGRMAMIVAGGSGISATQLAPGSNQGSDNTILQLTGSTGTGSGNRGAELVAGASPASASALAAGIAQPAAPAGWGALQARDSDGADLLAVARWSGADQGTFSLTDSRGAPVTTQAATVTGSTASVPIALDPDTPGTSAEVQETMRYFVHSSGPIQARQSAGGSAATLSNPSTSPATVTVSYVPGTGPTQTVSRTLAGGETATARVVGGRLVTAGPEYEPILTTGAKATALAASVRQWQRAGQISASDAATLTSAAGQISGDLRQAATDAVANSPSTGQEAALTASATSALARAVPAPGMTPAVARAVKAFHDGAASELAQAAAALRVTLLVEPDGTLQPGETGAFTVYALNRGQAAATSGWLSLSLPGSHPPAQTLPALAPGASTAITVHAQVAAGTAPWSDLAASAALSYTTQGGSTEKATATGEFTVTPLFTVTAAEPDVPLARGGWNQEKYTLTSFASQPLTVSFASQEPSGVTASMSATSASLPADGTAEVTATLANASAATGSGPLTLTATASNGVAATASPLLRFSANMALNPYGTPWPSPSASSTQAPRTPGLAFDGDTSTFWVSGGPATAGSGPTPQNPVTLGVDFGAPVTIGSVTMTPRPGYGPTDYSVQTSADGQNWTTLATVTSAPDAVVTTPVPVTTARYLRLVITGSHDATDRNVQVAELAATAP